MEMEGRGEPSHPDPVTPHTHCTGGAGGGGRCSSLELLQTAHRGDLESIISDGGVCTRRRWRNRRVQERIYIYIYTHYIYLYYINIIYIYILYLEYIYNIYNI